LKEILVTILLIVVLIFLFSPKPVEPIVITKVDTIVKVEKVFKYRKGDSIPFVVLGIDTLTIHDTMRIVEDYKLVRNYNDTIRIDSLGYAYISDTISENKIKGRGFKAEIETKTIRIETTKVNPPKNEVYLGFIGDLRRFDEKVGVGVGIGFKTAKNDLFQFSVTTNQLQIGYLKKIL
jgi:hypothetical protein